MAFYPNDMLSAAYLVGAVNDKPSREAIRQQYIGERLLPMEEVPERQVIWDVMYATNNLASFKDPRGQTIPMSRKSFSTEIATLADIGTSMNLEKWALSILRDSGMPAVYRSGGSANAIKSMRQRVQNHINENVALCNDAVDSHMEYIRLHALQGSVVWPPVDASGNTISVPMAHWNADMAVSVPFNLPSAQNQAATTLSGYSSRTGAAKAWTDASATPFNDLDIINEYMIKTLGIPMTGGTIYMSQVVLGYMSRNTSIVKWIAGSNREQPGARGYAGVEEMKQAIKTQFGWNIETYDAQWTFETHNVGTKPTVNRVPFLTEGKIIIVPAGGPGGTLMTVPLETEPNGEWRSGKVGWSYTDPKPPYDVEVGVNAAVWPRFTYYDWFVLDTYN